MMLKVLTHQAPAPSVGHVFALAVLRRLRRVEVVPEFMKERRADKDV
jgi:hypothetical protein